ncbi:MAG TPA: hypothetical protein VM866_09195 [Pyrinomonadaceae bacterium]|nr:hypothetical protein [Pyrinomonadaceae bacterium]
MKTCPKCARQYADDDSLCPVDGTALEPIISIDADTPAARGDSARDPFDKVIAAKTGAPHDESAEADQSQIAVPAAPPSTPTSNMWRVVIPATVALVMIFGLLYAYRPNSGGATDEEGRAPLTSDPNGRPVQALQPPSGESERDIVPVMAGVTSNSPAQPSPTTTGATGGLAGSEIFETTGLPTPTPVDNPTVISSDNSQLPDAKDANRPSPSPTASLSAKNANQQSTPPATKATPDANKEQPEAKPTTTAPPKPQTPAATPKPPPPARNSSSIAPPPPAPSL